MRASLSGFCGILQPLLLLSNAQCGIRKRFRDSVSQHTKVKALDSVRWLLSKVQSNDSIFIRLVYGQGGLKSDYFKTVVSGMCNVLKVDNIPYCVTLYFCISIDSEVSAVHLKNEK